MRLLPRRAPGTASCDSGQHSTAMTSLFISASSTTLDGSGLSRNPCSGHESSERGHGHGPHEHHVLASIQEVIEGHRVHLTDELVPRRRAMACRWTARAPGPIITHAATHRQRRDELVASHLKGREGLLHLHRHTRTPVARQEARTAAVLLGDAAGSYRDVQLGVRAAKTLNPSSRCQAGCCDVSNTPTPPHVPALATPPPRPPPTALSWARGPASCRALGPQLVHRCESCPVELAQGMLLLLGHPPTTYCQGVSRLRQYCPEQLQCCAQW